MYTDPNRRPGTVPKHDHIQATEERGDTDHELCRFPPAHYGHTSSVHERKQRNHVYREALEHVEARRVDIMGTLMRDKLNSVTSGGPYRLYNTFRCLSSPLPPTLRKLPVPCFPAPHSLLSLLTAVRTTGTGTDTGTTPLLAQVFRPSRLWRRGPA